VEDLVIYHQEKALLLQEEFLTLHQEHIRLLVVVKAILLVVLTL
jgi:hypothetical protein